MELAPTIVEVVSNNCWVERKCELLAFSKTSYEAKLTGAPQFVWFSRVIVAVPPVLVSFMTMFPGVIWPSIRAASNCAGVS